MQSLANELHKPVTHNFPKRKVYVANADHIFAADLVDMQSYSRDNKGYKYILSVIDVFSKYGWMVPLKDKRGETVANALEKVFKERRPQFLWVDKGKEFYNKHVKDLGVDLYSTENLEKSCVVERWNRTMKERMFKYFTAHNTRMYISILDDLVKGYNNSKHRTIGMTPVEASLKSNERRVYANLNKDKCVMKKPKFKVGDKVRIPVKKGHFEKGYTPRWTEEVFTVSDVQQTCPVTYKLTDLADEEIQGSFYEQELQKTSQEVFRIDKVIRRKGDKALVRWKGYPDGLNSWVDRGIIKNL